MDKQIAARVGRAISEKVFPGCVIGIVLENGQREILPFGTTIYGSAGEHVINDTMYDVASVTKSVPTASLTSLLLEENKLSPADKVRTHLPELQNDYDATIEDLLRYRVHGAQLSRLRLQTLEEIRAFVFEHGFDGPPGEPTYTNLPAYLLGLIVERVSGQSLDIIAKERYFRPLSMEHTTFFPTADDCAPTEIDEHGKEIRGIVHDESARIFAKAGRTVGHAGLFSTVPDLLHFLEALLAGDFPYIVGGAKKGLGWQLNDTNFMGQYPRLRTFGKTGFTGTSVICDIERGIAFVILSNRTYPKRPLTDDAIFAFRLDIADIIFENA